MYALGPGLHPGGKTEGQTRGSLCPPEASGRVEVRDN